MNRPEDLVEPDPVLHGQGKLGNEITPACPDHRGPQNPILSGHRQNLDKPLRYLICQRTIRSLEIKARDFKGNPSRLGLRFRQPHPCDLRIGVDGMREESVIDLEALEGIPEE